MGICSGNDGGGGGGTSFLFFYSFVLLFFFVWWHSACPLAFTLVTTYRTMVRRRWGWRRWWYYHLSSRQFFSFAIFGITPRSHDWGCDWNDGVKFVIRDSQSGCTNNNDTTNLFWCPWWCLCRGWQTNAANAACLNSSEGSFCKVLEHGVDDDWIRVIELKLKILCCVYVKRTKQK